MYVHELAGEYFPINTILNRENVTQNGCCFGNITGNCHKSHCVILKEVGLCEGCGWIGEHFYNPTKIKMSFIRDSADNRVTVANSFKAWR